MRGLFAPTIEAFYRRGPHCARELRRIALENFYVDVEKGLNLGLGTQ
ncbi:hypothetical protein EV132_101622 [Rhizobium sullae]|uniref:Uncharacterized protein n=1 Tax=Rhizobium sullae TaxID=50338 RepID=A0A4V2VAD4_RHISU|nr:hypothetical protein EV132_101622 [Rhizobium sullae]